MAAIPPPVAARRPQRHEKHGDVRVDNYYWLRERDDPEVRAYLEAENAYDREVTARTAAFEDRLFEEIRGRIKQTDMSVPYHDGEYEYYRRYEDGREYEIHCRRRIETPGGADAAAAGEQVILDVNQVAAGHEFCQVAARPVSPSGRLLAYAVDTVGRRQYSIRVRDLATGQDLPDVIPGVTANVAWAADSETLLYARHDPTTLRPYRILRHRLGGDPQEDRLVYEESDAAFSCGVWPSRSKRYLLIGSFQTLTTEFRYLDASDPGAPPKTFLPRERGHEYDIDHYRGRFYIRTNAGARNFRLLEAGDDRPQRDAWRELVPHREDVLIEGFELFRDHLVVAERHAGLTRIRVRSRDAGAEHHIAFDEPAYAVSIDTNRDPETTTLRFRYSSLTTPPSVYDYDMTTRARTLRKREAVLGDFDPARYETQRLLATAPDGVRVPISLVRRKRAAPDGPQPAGAAPLLLYGYGAYGISMEPTFRSSRLSLLDRGFTYAIAHVRGGEELGRWWYEAGKLRKKKNTFTDFAACAEHLVAEGHTAPERLFAMGGSAGGLLMGAVVNLRPDLFHGIVAQVPFVDVVTTMLDESIPLTTGEYDEWGNPNEPGDYAYIRSYSPYDNMEPVTWPHLLVMTGLHDSQVQYWEPAKWVARRRALQPDDGRRLLLKTNMDAGHGGASGRYRQYRETAHQYAFLLDLAGVADGVRAGDRACVPPVEVLQSRRGASAAAGDDDCRFAPRAGGGLKETRHGDRPQGVRQGSGCGRGRRAGGRGGNRGRSGGLAAAGRRRGPRGVRVRCLRDPVRRLFGDGAVRGAVSGERRRTGPTLARQADPVQPAAQPDGPAPGLLARDRGRAGVRGPEPRSESHRRAARAADGGVPLAGSVSGRAAGTGDAEGSRRAAGDTLERRAADAGGGGPQRRHRHPARHDHQRRGGQDLQGQSARLQPGAGAPGGRPVRSGIRLVQLLGHRRGRLRRPDHVLDPAHGRRAARGTRVCGRARGLGHYRSGAAGARGGLNGHSRMSKRFPVWACCGLAFAASIGPPAGAVGQTAGGEPGGGIVMTQVDVGDFVFDVRMAGPDDGEVVILLHGFPQTSYEWRGQIRALAAAGFRAVAPDQRGYSAGARPPAVEDYALPLLVQDAIGLADAIGADRFHVAGHDWGAVVAWVLAVTVPERVITANPVSVPHPDAFARVLNDPASCQVEASSYFDVFVQPDSEDAFLADDQALLRGIFAGIDGDAIAEYVRVLGSKPALGAALNWYRANIGDRTLEGPAAGAVAVPTMFTWSDGDTALCIDGALLTEQYVEGPYRFEVLEGVSHWIPDLASDAMSSLLVEHVTEYSER